MRHLKTTSLAAAKRIASNLYQPSSRLHARAFSSNQARQHNSSASLSLAFGTPQCHQGQRQSPLGVAAPQLSAGKTANHHPARSTCATTSQQRHYSSESFHTTNSAGQLQKTCLSDFHVAHGAKMVPFAGFSMPVLYSDQTLTESHLWTRKHASIFDVSHMVQQFFRGPEAGWFLERVTPCAARSMDIGTGALSALMLEGTGGMVDDCLISRIGEEDWYVVTNAGRRVEDAEFFRTRLFEYGFGPGGEWDGGVLWGTGEGTGMIALQGPEAVDVMVKCVMLGDGKESAASWDDFWFGRIEFAGVDLGPGEEVVKVLVSRGGYTGEDGFEIGLIDPEKAGKVVETLMKWGGGKVKLAGLGARDSLRLEAGMCLYGHDLDESVTPVEAGLSWIIPKERRDPESEPPFPGRERILGQLKSKSKGGAGVDRRRIGLVVEKGPPAREGAEIIESQHSPKSNSGAVPTGNDDSAEFHQVGVVTSGCAQSPSTGKNIAMGYVKDGVHKAGTKLEVMVRGRKREAEVVKMPFVETGYYRQH